jgi:hypothetical protein
MHVKKLCVLLLACLLSALGQSALAQPYMSQSSVTPKAAPSTGYFVYFHIVFPKSPGGPCYNAGFGDPIYLSVNDDLGDTYIFDERALSAWPLNPDYCYVEVSFSTNYSSGSYTVGGVATDYTFQQYAWPLGIFSFNNIPYPH